MAYVTNGYCLWDYKMGITYWCYKWELAVTYVTIGHCLLVLQNGHCCEICYKMGTGCERCYKWALPAGVTKWAWPVRCVTNGHCCEICYKWAFPVAYVTTWAHNALSVGCVTKWALLLDRLQMGIA